MKRKSLKEAADQDTFVHGKPLNLSRGIEVNIKKTSCYLPVDLWLKYKAYELDQAKAGESVSLNRLMIELLTEKLRKY